MKEIQMTEAEKKEYYEYLKKEYQKATATAKKYNTVVEFDTIESMHLAELEEEFEKEKTKQKVEQIC